MSTNVINIFFMKYKFKFEQKSHYNLQFIRTQPMSAKLTRHYQLTWWIDILFLLAFLGGLAFILLGARPLFVPDEGRYAEIAREMVSGNNYITPYLNGIKYFEKTILLY